MKAMSMAVYLPIFAGISLLIWAVVIDVGLRVILKVRQPTKRTFLTATVYTALQWLPLAIVLLGLTRANDKLLHSAMQGGTFLGLLLIVFIGPFILNGMTQTSSGVAIGKFSAFLVNLFCVVLGGSALTMLNLLASVAVGK